MKMKDVKRETKSKRKQKSKIKRKKVEMNEQKSMKKIKKTKDKGKIIKIFFCEEIKKNELKMTEN